MGSSGFLGEVLSSINKNSLIFINVLRILIECALIFWAFFFFSRKREQQKKKKNFSWGHVFFFFFVFNIKQKWGLSYKGQRKVIGFGFGF